jgi:hypothetical protein
METNIAVVEWSPDGARAYNPVTRQTAGGGSVQEALLKVGSPPVVGLCLSRRVSFVRETRVPAVEKSELRLIVNVQLENLFPAVKSELAFDYDLGTQHYDDGVQTTVCATLAESLRGALRDVAVAGAKVEWVAPTALGSTTVAGSLGHDDAIVVEQDGAHLYIDIVRHGMLVYSRSVTEVGSRHARQAEVGRTLAGYGLPSAAVVAVGETDLGDDVRRVPDGSLQAMAAHDASRVNVELPEAVATKLRRASQAKSRLALFLWLAVACVGALVYLDRDDEAREATRVRSKVTGTANRLKNDVDLYTDRLTTVGKNVDSLNVAFKPAQTAGEVLTVISNTLPSGAWLTGVTYERGRPLQIRGTALNGEVVTAYTSALALETRFRDVQLVFANNSEIEGTAVVHFAISVHVVGNLPLIDEKSARRAKK